MAKTGSKKENFALEAVCACIGLADERRAGSGLGEHRLSTRSQSYQSERDFKLTVRLDGRESITATCEVYETGALQARVTLVSHSGDERDNLRFRCTRPLGEPLKVHRLTGPGSKTPATITDGRDYERLIDSLGHRFEEWDIWTVENRTLGAWHKSWIFGHKPLVGTVETVIEMIGRHHDTIFSG